MVAEATKRLHQQQTAWRAPENSAAGQQQGQQGAAYNKQFPALPPAQAPQWRSPIRPVQPVQQPSAQQPIARGAPFGQQQAAGGRTSSPRNGAAFAGHCFTCNNVGHRSSECTREPQCFRCRQYGHISRDCTAEPVTRRSPSPKAVESCQLCYKQGVVLQNCPRCSPALSAWLGNLHVGGQEK